MVVKLVILYPPPADAAAFEAAYVDELMPVLLEKLPGLTQCVLSKAIWAVAGERPFHLMAEIYFPSLEALQNALSAETAKEIATHLTLISELDMPVSVVCMEEVITGFRTDSIDS